MNKRLPIWVVAVAFVVGNGFVFVNPPLRAPDEWAHYSRAYQLSVLHLKPEERDRILGGYVPAGIIRLDDRFSKVMFRGVSAREIAAAGNIPFDAGHPQFRNFPSIAVYPWLPFVPQAIGIAIGRVCFGSALAIMYVGREANLVAYVALVYWALTLMPDAGCRLTLALIALLPMSLYQAASLSADGLTAALAILVAVVVWRLAFGEGEVSGLDVAALLAATICLSLTKLAYCELTLITLAIPPSKFGTVRRYWLTNGAILFLNGLVVGLWFWQFHGVPTICLNAEVNPAGQRAFVAHHPAEIIPILMATAEVYGREIVTGVIGTFGWNEILLPVVLVVIYYALLMMSVGVSGKPRSWRAAMIAVFTGIVSFGVMMWGYYVQTRPVGERTIAGFQGRYLIPLLPLLIFLGGRKSGNVLKVERMLVIVGMLIAAFSVFYLMQVVYPAAWFSRFEYRWTD